MPSKKFDFKQFSVHHDRCAMKVGFDSVLFGAWAAQNIAADRVLDIGSGTGLLSLIYAQFNPKARITGVEIDKIACQQARENVAASPWADRIQLFDSSIQAYQKQAKQEQYTYDLVISNPPYFKNSLKSPNTQRTHARHTDALSYETLLHSAKNLLAPNGQIALILPSENVAHVSAICSDLQLNLLCKVSVKTVPHKPAKRSMLQFGLSKADLIPIQEQELYTGDGKHYPYGEAYRELTKELYLFF